MRLPYAAGFRLLTIKKRASGMKRNYFGMIREIIKSDSYLQRLKYFHLHYQNAKCEERYRDALLEAFNRKHRTLDETPLKSHFFMLDMTHRLPLNAA
jgi:hypothetical protein